MSSLFGSGTSTERCSRRRGFTGGLERPPKSAAEYLATLEQCRLTETVARLRPHAAEI